MRLCHSRMYLVQIFPRESQEMVFEAHERAFRFFGGVCRRGIYDNMKTAVSTVFVGKKRDYNRRFQEMCSHHLVEPVACTPGAGWEKGQVEKQVGDLRGRLFARSPRGRSYAEINEWLMDRCIIVRSARVDARRRQEASASDDHRGLLAAGCAFPAHPATLQLPASVMAAGGADEAVGPTHGGEMAGTGGLVGKARLEGGAGHRSVLFPAAGHVGTIREHKAPVNAKHHIWKSRNQRDKPFY